MGKLPQTSFSGFWISKCSHPTDNHNFHRDINNLFYLCRHWSGTLQYITECTEHFKYSSVGQSWRIFESHCETGRGTHLSLPFAEVCSLHNRVRIAKMFRQQKTLSLNKLYWKFLMSKYWVIIPNWFWKTDRLKIKNYTN